MTVITRETRETRVRVELNAGPGEGTIDTGVRFLDHMLATFARYAGVELSVMARGDLPHHLIEDTAIAIGTALDQFRAERIVRYGDRTIPMDDALVHACIDLGGRPFYRGPLPSTLYDHWMRSFADHARATVHLRVLRGTDRHHIVEGAFKALGMALRDALVESSTLASTKGSVRWENAESSSPTPLAPGP
jgi:imidazoleglycerol-phosphate dehydratase